MDYSKYDPQLLVLRIKLLERISKFPPIIQYNIVIPTMIQLIMEKNPNILTKIMLQGICSIQFGRHLLLNMNDKILNLIKQHDCFTCYVFIFLVRIYFYFVFFFVYLHLFVYINT